MSATVPSPAHDCGICDGALQFDGWSGDFATWKCTNPACGWWHTAKDCCQVRSFTVGVPVTVGTWNTHTVEANSAEEAVDALKRLIQSGPWLGWDEEGDVLFEDITWDRAEVEEA